MAEPFLPPGVSPPDFYIAAMGRSGSTMLCNWLTRPPDQLVFVEPFFLRKENPRLLRIQLANFGMPVSDEDWRVRDESAEQRFERLMTDRLPGRRWAFKEVLSSEHSETMKRLAPAKVLLTVRNIRDVALSFFEKHRQQQNLDRFSDDWVVDYCQREAAGIIDFRELMNSLKISYRIVRYEDFTTSHRDRRELISFTGWDGDGDVDSHLVEFDRGFEIERHGNSISSKIMAHYERNLSHAQFCLADEIEERCVNYQLAFGYD